MRVAGNETCPLPEDPVLAATAIALNDAGYWAEIVDGDWRYAYLTDDARLIYGGRIELAPITLGAYMFGPERATEAMGWRGGQFPLEIMRQLLALYGPWLLADAPGGHDEVRALVDQRLRDIVDGLTPVTPPPTWSWVFRGIYSGAGTSVEIRSTGIRLRDISGQIVGTAFIHKPAVGMAAISRITAMGDLRHFRRMEHVAKPGRRPAAILFADLESSSALARGLSTAGYFALVRRLAREADRRVIDAGGLVGTHAGDGVVAFFLAHPAGSESAAARACITASRALREAIPDLATRSDLQPTEVVMRFGLHWGANLYVGQIATPGRTEITALGDQVNEAARIEACATGGLALASKDLIERLDPDDAAALDLDCNHLTYTPLAELVTATEKARRDAPAIAVCAV
jgi:class 3 adenylate cyclase